MVNCRTDLGHFSVSKRQLWHMYLVLGDRGRQISEFEASLVYRVSSRTARATQRNPVLKKQNKTKQNDYLTLIASVKVVSQNIISVWDYNPYNNFERPQASYS